MTEDTEEVVLTRWEKIKKWVEIAMATKKLAAFLWTLVFGVGGAVVVGEVTKTTPLRDAAIEIGLVEPEAEAIVGVSIPEHTHEHSHKLKKHSHPAQSAGEHTHPELKGMPEDHGALH